MLSGLGLGLKVGQDLRGRRKTKKENEEWNAMQWNETVQDGMPLYYETREREREKNVSLAFRWWWWWWSGVHGCFYFLSFSGRNDVIPLSASAPARESESESESNSERERRRREGKPLYLFLPLSCFFFYFFSFFLVWFGV